MKVQVFKKENGKFKVVTDSKYLDMCAILAKKAKAPFLIQIIIENAKQTAPMMIHACPYFGLHQAVNITFPRQLVAFYPNGEFKLTWSYTDGDKETANAVVTVITS